MLSLSPELYSVFIRPLLFALSPDAAQSVADLVLKRRFIWRALSPAMSVRSPRLEVDLCGLKLQNPVGLAAGFDKSCEFIPSMAALGFGYITAGTVTRYPKPGNPKPRMFRYVKDSSLINALGFPGRGLEYAVRRLEIARDSVDRVPIIVSVSGITVDEVVECHRRLEPLVHAVEINISSPNTAGLRAFHGPQALGELLARINDRRNKQLFLKLPPLDAGFAPWRQAQLDIGEIATGPETYPGHPSPAEATEQLMALARTCAEQGVDALTVSNTRPTEDLRLSVRSGGLSGKLVFPHMLQMVADIRAELGEGVSINACGGIFTGEDAWKALQAGATTVQLLTGLIYRGPGIVKRINQELLKLIEMSSPRPD